MTADDKRLDVPLVEYALDFESNYDFAAKQWQREDEFYGPPPARTLPKRSESLDSTDPEPLDFNNLPPVLTLAQTASIIGKTVPAIKAMLYRNELPATRVGKRGRRIKRDELLKQFGIGVKRGKK